MHIRRIIKPGQPGTKRLMEKYGDKLVCVRYIYDEDKQIRYKTAEIIINQQKWEKNHQRIPANKIVDIYVEWGERDLARSVKLAGGIWNAGKKVWQLPYYKVMLLGIDNRIIE